MENAVNFYDGWSLLLQQFTYVHAMSMFFQEVDSNEEMLRSLTCINTTTKFKSLFSQSWSWVSYRIKETAQ